MRHLIPTGASRPPLHPPRLAAALFLLFSALYFLTRTPALDEWDSVQFALGVGDFNLWRHQPHPPGYPVYLAFGWLGSHAFPLDVPTALALGSALGGGLFVACWFLLIARHFNARISLLAAVTLGTLLITWMTATKVLTDGLGAGMLALTLLSLDEAAGWRITLGAFLAGVAAGVRPQNTAILLLIVVLSLRDERLSRRQRTAALSSFVAGCLAWLLPTLALQAHTPEAHGDWLAYPRQLLAQWRWRLDQPKAFLAATGQTKTLLLSRLDHHFLGWLTRGAGFSVGSPWGWLAIALVALGYAFYLWLPDPDTPAGARPFWRRHLPWSLAYVLMIFCFLPGDQRYYLPIYPLLVLPIAAGWVRVLGDRSAYVWALPALTFGVALPYAIENHAEPAPPVRLVRFLQAAWPPTQRPEVWLILRDARRHADWYAPDFHIVPAENFATAPLPTAPPPRAVYTDDPQIADQPLRSGHWQQVAAFRRSPLIYRKHNEADLYRLMPQSLVE